MGGGIKAWRQAGSRLWFALYCKHTLPHTHSTPAHARKHTQTRGDAFLRCGTRAILRPSYGERCRKVSRGGGYIGRMVPLGLLGCQNAPRYATNVGGKQHAWIFKLFTLLQWGGGGGQGHLKVRPHIRTYISLMMSSANSHSWMGARAEVQMKMQRWETECEENPRSKDLGHLSKGSFSTEGSFAKEWRGERFIVGQKGGKAGCLVGNKVPALKCDAALRPESDPLRAPGCQECSQLGSGAREKIKHTLCDHRTVYRGACVCVSVCLCI